MVYYLKLLIRHRILGLEIIPKKGISIWFTIYYILKEKFQAPENPKILVCTRYFSVLLLCSKYIINT